MPAFLIPLAIGAAKAGVSYAQKRKAAKESEKFAGEIRGEQEAMANKLAQQTQDYGLGSNMRKYAQFGMMDQAQAQRDIAKQQSAEGIGALKKGGAKALLGGLGAIQQQQFQNMAGIEQAETQRQQGIQKDIASEEQAIAREKYGAAREDLGQARDLAMQARMGQFAAQQAKRDAAFELGKDAIGLAGNVAGAAGDAGGFKNLGNLDLQDSMSAFGMEKGGQIKETPGAFSHRSNPIDIVRRGAKIGEMTGGETIMNPEQTKKVERLAKKGKTELHKYLNGLFKEFNRKQLG